MLNLKPGSFKRPLFLRGLARSTHFFLNWKKNLDRLATLEREHAFARYEILSNPLNPHFLFNALTSVNTLIFENQSLASDFLQQLSKVYRYVLQHKQHETVSVGTEIDFVASYVSLLQTRFAGAIEFDVALSEICKRRKIVPVTLQILIENTVKHNIACRANPLKISITNTDAFIIVTNNISKKYQPDTSNHQGLANLKCLYLHLVARPIEILENENYFSVKIPLI